MRSVFGRMELCYPARDPRSQEHWPDAEIEIALLQGEDSLLLFRSTGLFARRTPRVLG